MKCYQSVISGHERMTSNISLENKTKEVALKDDATLLPDELVFGFHETFCFL